LMEVVVTAGTIRCAKF